MAVREGPAAVKSHPRWRQQRIQRTGQDGEVEVGGTHLLTNTGQIQNTPHWQQEKIQGAVQDGEVVVGKITLVENTQGQIQNCFYC